MAYSLELGALTLEPFTKDGVKPKRGQEEVEIKPRCSKTTSSDGNKRQVFLRETLSTSSSQSLGEKGVILVPTHSRNNLITMALSSIETRKITSDLIVHVQDSTYLTHKIILYVHCGYFANIFRRYKGTVLGCITLKQINDRAFLPIYEFMYSGEVKVNSDNVDDVLELSTTLDMPDSLPTDLTNAILKFKESSFHESKQTKNSRKDDTKTSLSDGTFPKNSSEPLAPPPHQNPKRGGTHKETILIIGGRNPIRPKKNNDYLEGLKIYQFVPGKDIWRNTRTSPVPWDHACVQVLNGTVYICGGWTSKFGRKLRASPKMWSYSPKEDQWKQLTNMTNSRVHHAAVEVDGKIYVIGGTDGNDKMFSSVECYDPTTNQWSTVAPLPFPCIGMAATRYKDQIWVCGGLKQAPKHTSGALTDACHVYSPREDVWYEAPRLRIPRAFASLIVVMDQMYLVGGIGTTKFEEKVAQSISDIDIYHSENKSWIHWTDMFDPRHCFGTVAIGSDLYVVGGMSSATGDVLTSVEQFDTVQRKCFISVHLPVGLAGMGCLSLTNIKT